MHEEAAVAAGLRSFAAGSRIDRASVAVSDDKR
jgi:hypothetical protein